MESLSIQTLVSVLLVLAGLLFLVIKLTKRIFSKILKPKWFIEELENHFQKYHKVNINENEIRESFPVKYGNKISLIPISDIVDFTVESNYVFLNDISGEKYIVDTNLKDLETKLPKNFIRVHKSAIINSKLIEKIKRLDNGKYDLIMQCEKERIITCSKNYNDRIKEIINF